MNVVIEKNCGVIFAKALWLFADQNSWISIRSLQLHKFARLPCWFLILGNKTYGADVCSSDVDAKFCENLSTDTKLWTGQSFALPFEGRRGGSNMSCLQLSCTHTAAKTYVTDRILTRYEHFMTGEILGYKISCIISVFYQRVIVLCT